MISLLTYPSEIHNLIMIIQDMIFQDINQIIGNHVTIFFRQYKYC
jgi:hypothetical protein